MKSRSVYTVVRLWLGYTQVLCMYILHGGPTAGKPTYDIRSIRSDIEYYHASTLWENTKKNTRFYFGHSILYI